MNYRNLINDAWVYSSNARAEDGPPPPRGWRVLCDTVLVPLGLYAALFLLLLLASHSSHEQTGSGRIAGSVKDAREAVIPGSKVDLMNTVGVVAKQKNVPLISYFFWTWYRGTPETMEGLQLIRLSHADEEWRAKHDPSCVTNRN